MIFRNALTILFSFFLPFQFPVIYQARSDLYHRGHFCNSLQTSTSLIIIDARGEEWAIRAIKLDRN